MTNKTIAEPTLRHIAVGDLIAASNIRQDVDRQGLDEMKASILAHGVLQNLIASPRTSDGRYAVYGGGRRLAAAQELVTEGLLAADTPLPVLCFDDIDSDSADAIALAMSENMIRRQMDYVDECAAMLQLANAGKTKFEIAAIFGFRPITVEERLYIGQLCGDAHKLLRTKTRTLEWARALTVADRAMQQKICDDIAANPSSWKTGDEIRLFLTRSTISVKEALFDRADYDGVVIGDFFDGDKFADIGKFWELQNEAIEEMKRDIEAEGWQEVTVIHQPLKAWEYETTTNRAEGLCFIEVSPTGKVEVHRGLKKIVADHAPVASLDASDAAPAADAVDTIAPHEVRPTTSICEYAAAQRSAMVQVALANDFRKALEYSVLAMLGHRNASFGTTAYALPGGAEGHVGQAFAARAAVIDGIEEMTRDAAAAGDAAARDRALVAMVSAMDDQALQGLFAGLTALRAGQQGRRSLDDGDGSLMNHFGASLDVRSFWTPDTAFFNMMSSEDLRRIATAIMPGATVTRFAASKKKDLVRMLATNFGDAAEGGVMSVELAERFNSWVPGVMAFPAIVDTIDTGAEAALFEGGAVEDLLFDADEA